MQNKKLKDGTYDSKGKLVDLKTGYQVSVRTEGMSKNKETRILKTLPKKYTTNIYTGIFNGVKERSFTVSNKKEAIALAKKYNQKSVWNNKKGEEIVVNPNVSYNK